MATNMGRHFLYALEAEINMIERRDKVYLPTALSIAMAIQPDIRRAIEAAFTLANSTANNEAASNYGFFNQVIKDMQTEKTVVKEETALSCEQALQKVMLSFVTEDKCLEAANKYIKELQAFGYTIVKIDQKDFNKNGVYNNRPNDKDID